MRFGPFRGVARLGEGAIGEVWRAVHEASGEEVAVKRLHPEHGARWRSLLRREVEAVARLDHPAVVWIHDHGVADDGAPWIALELASGGTLDGRRPADWSMARQLLDELLPALQHAHARGVLHRDLKPANVLLCTLDDARPGPKWCDFSLASVAGARGPGGGTPDYLAPEQRDGRWADEGPWTDLYGLGGLAWALVCGGPPTTTPWAPRFPVPSDLRDWVEELRAPAVRDRFPTAAAARAALGRLATVPGAGTSGRTFDGPGDDRPARRHPKRMPASLALVGLRPVPLVGRTEERRVLLGVLRGLSTGDPKTPRAVRLVGGPGVGTSHLARWLATTAREQDAVDVVTWGHRGDGVADALQALARRPGSAAPPLPPRDEDPLAALLGWVTAAPRPVLVVADPWEPVDAQLLRAAAALPGGRLGVVATARPDAPLRGVHDLPIGPHPEPGGVARALGVGDPASIEALVRRAAGRPGAVVGLVRDLAARGDLVDGEAGWALRPGVELPVGDDAAAHVPAADRPVLSLLALLAGVATLDEWRDACEAAGVPCPPDHVEALRRRGLVVVDGDVPRVADEAVREALARAAERRPDWARAAAAALREDAVPRFGAPWSRVGRAGVLWFLAGEPARAYLSLLFPIGYGAATDEECHLLLDRAEVAVASLPPAQREDCGRQVARSRAIAWSNHGRHARAVEAVSTLDDPSPLGALTVAAVLLRAGYPHRALRPAREAFAGLHEGRMAVNARLELARILVETGRTEEALALALTAGSDPRAVLLCSLCHTVSGEYGAAAADLDALDGSGTAEIRGSVLASRIASRVDRGLASWEEVEAANADPLSFASVHLRVSITCTRVLAAALVRPAELARAEAELREELAGNPLRSIGHRLQLERAAAATTGELARRILDLAAGQLPLDGPEDELTGP